MSESYDNAIEDIKREIAARMRTVNDLLKMQGKEPLYPDPDAVTSTGSMKIRRDQFYTHGLSTAVREYLNLRKHLGPATLDEIYSALVNGSFQFDAKGEAAKPSLKQSLHKNTAIFHRLPNQTYGLAEWYPNRKNEKEEEATQPKKRKSAMAKAANQPKKAKVAAPEKTVESRPEGEAGTSGKTPSLVGAVKEGIRSFQAPFTKQQLVNWLNDRYPELKPTSEGRRTSIFSMVAHLKDEMGLRVVKEGKGREPSVYQVSLNGHQN